jgi:RNA polymerase sigma-70 factor (ECF subfamily)
MTEPDTTEPALPETGEVARTLVDNHRAFLAFVERRVGRRDVAEDILQEAFVRGTAHAAELRDPGALVPWFYRMLRNAIVDHQRRTATADKALVVLARELEVEAPGSEAHAAVCGCVRELASTLKPEYAVALQRIEVDGLPVKDFAAEVGISASNAGVRIFRAREALKKQVQRSCGTCAEHGCLDCTCGGEAGHHV